LSNLDAALRVTMRALIKRLHRNMRTTFVYVTHDQAEAMTMADRIVVMRNGVIQQLGTPHEIYHRPRNLFVASFLGSPQINLVEGRLDANDAGAVFIRGGLRVSLADARLASQGGREVLLGIRPEDLRLGGSDLTAAAELVSPLGSEQYVNARLGDIELVLRVDKDVTVSTGDRLPLGLDPRRLHVFDKQTGESLSGQPEP